MRKETPEVLKRNDIWHLEPGTVSVLTRQIGKLIIHGAWDRVTRVLPQKWRTQPYLVLSFLNLLHFTDIAFVI